MIAHTPKPWGYSLDELTATGQLLIRAIGDIPQPVIAEVDPDGNAKDDATLFGNAQVMVAAPDLLDAARAALLFHSASPWDVEKAAEWKRLTGSDDATTRALCEFLRVAIAKAAP